MSVTLCPSDEDYAFGCLDESACNYDPSAEINAGCEYSRHVTGAQILQHAILTQQHCMKMDHASNWIVPVNVGAMPRWIAMVIAMVQLSPNAISVLEEILRLIR